jgi:hypothetical protein
MIVENTANKTIQYLEPIMKKPDKQAGNEE